MNELLRFSYFLEDLILAYLYNKIGVKLLSKKNYITIYIITKGI